MEGEGMDNVELHLLDNGRLVLTVPINPGDGWAVINDHALAAETAEQAIADSGLDYRVIDVEGHFPGIGSEPHIIPVHVESIG